MSYLNPHVETLAPYVPGEQPGADDVVKLNTNENPYPPSPAVVEAIAAVGADQLRRYPDPLAAKFRRVAAEVLGVAPEMIVCGNGMDDLLNLVLMAHAGPGRHVVSPMPSYTYYAVRAEIHRAEMVAVEFPPDFSLPIDELVSAGGAVTFVANPNSPSGTFVPIDRIADLADRLAGLLVVDEAYVDFADDNALRLVERFDNVLVLRTLSKGYSLAGMRFGYGVGQPALIDGILRVKDSYNTDAVSEAAASAAIADRQYADQCHRAVREERSRLTEALTGLGFSVLPSRANFLLARWGGGSAGTLYEALAERNIYVRYFDAPRLDDCLRITVGTREQDDALLDALRRIV